MGTERVVLLLIRGRAHACNAGFNFIRYQTTLLSLLSFRAFFTKFSRSLFADRKRAYSTALNHTYARHDCFSFRADLLTA